MIGQWRVEAAPGIPRKDDVFLHVIQVGDQTLESMDELELIEDDRVCGIKLKADRQTWEVVFNKTGELGGHIKNTSGMDKSLTTEVQTQAGI
jgi:gamma-glutamylcyclotransferase (GGCT)/AIG2-like uncharacterized protein YtfP